MRGELRRLMRPCIDRLPDAFPAQPSCAPSRIWVDDLATALICPRPRCARDAPPAICGEGLSRDITATADAFAFDGERCDRIVARVLQSADSR
jgi:RNA polymerase sigma-70 factor (ECF subfamily)